MRKDISAIFNPKCLIPRSKILLNVFHNMSVTVCYQCSILGSKLATFGCLQKLPHMLVRVAGGSVSAREIKQFGGETDKRTAKPREEWGDGLWFLEASPLASGRSVAKTFGSLSMRVFQAPTATVSELFSFLTRPHTTTFTLLSIFSPLKINMISLAYKISHCLSANHNPKLS